MGVGVGVEAGKRDAITRKTLSDRAGSCRDHYATGAGTHSKAANLSLDVGRLRERPPESYLWLVSLLFHLWLPISPSF